LFDDYSDGLVLNIASQCSNTIVSIHNAGPRIVDAWIDHPNVTAVIFAHTPGQESGNALVEVIYGKQSPSGRMPYTLAKQESDYGALLRPSLPDQKNPMFPQSDFTEGLNIDVRIPFRDARDMTLTEQTVPSIHRQFHHPSLRFRLRPDLYQLHLHPASFQQPKCEHCLLPAR
jgi:hypothetical protein